MNRDYRAPFCRMAELWIDEQRLGLWHLPAASYHRMIALKIFTILTEGYDTSFETVSHAVLLFDRFLWHTLQANGTDLTLHSNQVFSIATFLIVSKLRDTSAPAIAGLIKVCSCFLQVNANEILESEEQILSILDWNVNFHTGLFDFPLHSLAHITRSRFPIFAPCIQVLTSFLNHSI